MKYDYLIVGAGFYGSICAYELNKRGKKVCVIDKRDHIGGNVYTEKKYTGWESFIKNNPTKIN